MNQSEQEDEEKLRKLGRRLGQGFTRLHPMQAKNMQQIRDAIREQWHLDRAANFTRDSSGPAKTPQPKPPEPGKGR